MRSPSRRNGNDAAIKDVSAWLDGGIEDAAIYVVSGWGFGLDLWDGWGFFRCGGCCEGNSG